MLKLIFWKFPFGGVGLITFVENLFGPVAVRACAELLRNCPCKRINTRGLVKMTVNAKMQLMQLFFPDFLNLLVVPFYRKAKFIG